MKSIIICHKVSCQHLAFSTGREESTFNEPLVLLDRAAHMYPYFLHEQNEGSKILGKKD